MKTISSQDSLHLLALECRRVDYKKGSTIHTSDSAPTIFMIDTGYVKRYSISNDGVFGVQSLYGPNDIFPLTAVYKVLFDLEIHNSLETYYYDAMCDATILILDNSRLIEEVTNNPLMFKDILFVAGRRLESNIQRLENANIKTVYKRIAHQLLFFANKFGKKYAQGTRIAIPLTQQDIADSLNITRETASRALSQLKTDKIIKTGRFIVITDIEALKVLAFN